MEKRKLLKIILSNVSILLIVLSAVGIIILTLLFVSKHTFSSLSQFSWIYFAVTLVLIAGAVIEYLFYDIVFKPLHLVSFFFMGATFLVSSLLIVTYLPTLIDALSRSIYNLPGILLFAPLLSSLTMFVLMLIKQIRGEEKNKKMNLPNLLLLIGMLLPVIEPLISTLVNQYVHASISSYPFDLVFASLGALLILSSALLDLLKNSSRHHLFSSYAIFLFGLPFAILLARSLIGMSNDRVPYLAYALIPITSDLIYLVLSIFTFLRHRHQKPTNQKMVTEN